MKKATIVFYPNKQKLRKRSNEIPIYLRIRRDNKKVEICLDVSITINELHYWDEINERLEIKDTAVNKRLED